MGRVPTILTSLLPFLQSKLCPRRQVWQLEPAAFRALCDLTAGGTPPNHPGQGHVLRPRQAGPGCWGLQLLRAHRSTTYLPCDLELEQGI